jgi:hypothetical protein
MPRLRLCARCRVSISLERTWYVSVIQSNDAKELTDLQQIAYAKSKSDTIAKLDGSFKMPEPEREEEPEETPAQIAGFGAAPAKAVPVNAPDATKGQKRIREEEEEDDDEDAEMEMDESDEESD